MEDLPKVKFQRHTQLTIDCISRAIFLGKDFDDEIKHLNKFQPVNGVLSIGEIANNGNTVLQILNKTIVVAQWIEK